MNDGEVLSGIPMPVLFAGSAILLVAVASVVAFRRSRPG